MENLDEAISVVAAAFHGSKFRELAEHAAHRLGVEAVEPLATELHSEIAPPETLARRFPGLGEWMAARQFAIFEILECLGAPALPLLRRIAFGDYDWTQGNAIEILCRLAARGIDPERIGADVEALLPSIRDEAVDYAMEPLLRRANQDARLRDFLKRHATFATPAVVGQHGELIVHGLSGGRRVVRKPASLEEAARALAHSPNVPAGERTHALYGFWEARRKPKRPPEDLAASLLDVWRGRLNAYGREAAPARNDEFEHSERWIRLADLGLLLPLTPDDLHRLRTAATVLLSHQSTAWKRLEKLTRAK